MKNSAWGPKLEDNAGKLRLNWAAGEVHVHREVSLDELIQTKSKASLQRCEYTEEGPLSSGRNYFLIPKDEKKVVEMENVGSLPKNHLFI